jgi:hypothetical protein
MTKTYLLPPVVALLVFAGVYLSHIGGMKEREAAAKAKTEAVAKAKAEAEAESRKVAMAEAIAQAETRKKERAAKEAAEAVRKDERQAALDARAKAYQEQEKLSRQAERLKKEIEGEQTALAKLAADAKEAAAEEAFLREFVAKAQANARDLESVAVKLAAPVVGSALAR